MKLKWTKAALADFNNVQNFIAEENLIAAQAVAKRIANATQMLLDQPQIGRTGNRSNTREWMVKKTPYLIVYRIEGGYIQIVRLWHGRQNWKR